MMTNVFRYPPIVLLLLLGYQAPEAKAQADPDPARFAEEIAAFEAWDRRNTPPEQPVLFVGSSSIRMWPTAERFPHLAVVNRGFGGSHLSDVLHYLPETVLRYEPRAIVLYEGDNDVASGKSPEQVLEDYRTFVRAVHEAQPGTPIVFVAIKPSLSRWALWPEMQRANTLVRRFSEAHPALYYADLAAPMLGREGKPDPALFVEDGLHLSEAGYDLWDRALQPVLDQALEQDR